MSIKLGLGASVFAGLFFLAGCSDSSSSNHSDSVNDIAALPTVGLTSLQLSDVDSSYLEGVDVEVVGRNNASPVSRASLSAVTNLSDHEGWVYLQDALAPGTYTLMLRRASQGLGSQPVEVKLLVGENNALESTSLPVPVDKCFVEQDVLAFGALSGVIYSATGPLEGATVALSAGAATNGVFRSAETDAQGRFVLGFNFQSLNTESDSLLLNALSETTLRVAMPGYESSSLTVDLTKGTQTGINLALVAMQSTQPDFAIWLDDFSQPAHWTVSGGYTSHLGETGWTIVERGHTIRNQLWLEAVLPGLGDTSGGALPQPRVGNRAWWFGNPASGNFIGQRRLYSTGMDGGSSAVRSIRGSLTSAPIDLPANGPISLTFQTWWEIESVNPNKDGFDWMDVRVSIAGEDKFVTLARLNPLADPVSTVDRDALPFSTAGFNRAPIWLQQEPISLEEFAGQSIQIRFVFDTKDELYNGFRGWMLDDLKILPVQGTHPRFEGDDFDFDDWYWPFASGEILPQSVHQERARFNLNPQR